MSVAQAVTHICENFVGRQRSARGRFACADFIGGFDIISDESGNCSGTIVSESETLSYSFFRRAGADAVLKKLGDDIVDLGIIGASSQSGSNTRDSTFNLTQYSGYKNIGTGNIVFMPVSWSNNGGTGKDMDNFQGPAIKSYDKNTGIVTLQGASGTGYGWGASIASARFIIIT